MKQALMKIIQRLQKKNKLLDLCVVGLGNPGDKYNRTRHNAGYDFLDRILDIKSLSLENSKKIDAQYAEIIIGNLSIGFVKPNEFINLSGKTMSLLKKYKVKSTEDILVLHDDMDLEPGEVKLKIGGGHAGHNGLRDILNSVGDNFVRLRFGIGHPSDKKQTNAWVTKKPTPAEKRGLSVAFEKCESCLDDLLMKKWLIVMNKLHSNEH